MKNRNVIYYDSRILNFAKGLKSAGMTRENVVSVRNTFFSTPELESALINPGIAVDIKKSIIDKVFTNKLEASSVKTLLVHNSIKDLEAILCALDDLYFKDSGIVRAKLIYAAALPDSNQLKSMENHILSNYECQSVEWEFSHDPKLIDGFILEVDGHFYDYSVNGKYNRLLDHLIRR